MRGSEAIREMFGLSRAFGSVFRGFIELIGLSRLDQARIVHPQRFRAQQGLRADPRD